MIDSVIAYKYRPFHCVRPIPAADSVHCLFRPGCPGIIPGIKQIQLSGFSFAAKPSRMDSQQPDAPSVPKLVK